MFFLYIDESGKPAPTDSSPIFCLAGIAFHVDSWNTVNTDYLNTKNRFFSVPTYEEVKASNILNFPNKDNRRNIRFVHNVLDIALKRRPRIFSVALYKNEFYSSYKAIKGRDFDHKGRALPMCLKKLILSYHSYLSNERSPKEKGIIILDSTSFYAQDYELAKTINKYIFDTQDRSTFSIIESPFFGLSHLLSILQIADFLSYIIRGRLIVTNYQKTNAPLADKYKHLDQYWKRINSICDLQTISRYTP